MNAYSYAETLGGKGANQAVAAARAGAAIVFWTALGNDSGAEIILERLSSALASVEAVRIESPSDRSAIAVGSSGENHILSSVACAQAFDPFAQTSLRHRIRQGDLLVLQGNLRASVTTECLRIARKLGATTLLNASPWGETQPLELSDVDLLIVNLTEAQALTGLDAPADTLATLKAGGAASVVITLGADGAIACGRDGAVISVTAPRVAAVDTSGAGDVFCGVLAGLSVRNHPLASALRIAARAAAMAVTRPGTLSSCPSAEEIAEIVEEERVAADG